MKCSLKKTVAMRNLECGNKHLLFAEIQTALDCTIEGLILKRSQHIPLLELESLFEKKTLGQRKIPGHKMTGRDHSKTVFE